MVVAALDVPEGAAKLNADAGARLDHAAALYRERPGTVRVLAYAAAATGGNDELLSYRAALDRADLVAKALALRGIPADRIRTEAVPEAADQPAGRVEVRLQP